MTEVGMGLGRAWFVSQVSYVMDLNHIPSAVTVGWHGRDARQANDAACIDRLVVVDILTAHVYSASR